MSGWHSGKRSGLLLSVLAAPVVLSWLACPAPAQAPPPAKPPGTLLDEARRMEQVVAQKAEAEFRAGVLEAHRLALKDPAAGIERFRTLLTGLDGDTALTPARREALRRMLQDRIRVLEAEAGERARDEAEAAARQKLAEKRQGADDLRKQEQRKLQEGVDNVRRLTREGQTEQAAREAADLARNFPRSPAATAGKVVTGAGESAREQRAARTDLDQRTDVALLDVVKSAAPIKGDVEFPAAAKWREITQKRNKPQTTEKERAILKTLDAPVTVSFRGSNVEAAIDYLQTVLGLPILLDKATLEMAGVTYETPVNANVRNVTLRTLLRKMLGDLGLTYVIRNEAVQIVTQQQARELMIVRTYYLGDLAGTMDAPWNPVFGPMVAMERVNNLMQMITGSIDPDSWAANGNGGRGTITFDPRSLTLVIRQSAEVHSMLGGGAR